MEAKTKSTENIFELIVDMKHAVDKAIEQLDAGKGKTHEQVMTNAKQKFPNLKFA